MEPSWHQNGIRGPLGGISGRFCRNARSGDGRATFPPTFYWQLELQLGFQNGAKMAKKSIQKSIIFLMSLGIDSWMDFGGFLVLTCFDLGTQKIDFWMDVLAILVPFWEPSWGSSCQ